MAWCAGESRTPAEWDLKPSPLPLGYRHVLLQSHRLRKQLGRHPGRAAQAARPGTQVPRHHGHGRGTWIPALAPGACPGLDPGALGRDDNGGNCASSYAIALRGARAETRTRTDEGLSLAPLPLGYTGRKEKMVRPREFAIRLVAVLSPL